MSFDKQINIIRTKGKYIPECEPHLNAFKNHLLDSLEVK